MIRLGILSLFIKLFTFICLCTMTAEAASKEEVFEHLRKMDVEKLLEVEVILDDVFDIFDGLLEVKQDVSVATGRQQTVERAPSVTSVITAMDMEAMGVKTVDEALVAVPGLHIRKGALSYRTLYTLRGIAALRAPQLLVLINGISARNLYGGNQGWGNPIGNMPVSQVARIEVIRGPASALYGADAIAGVINIITKTAQDFQEKSEVGASVGSFNTQQVWATAGGNYLGADFGFALEYNETDGQKELVETDAQTNLDKIQGTHASHAPGPVNLSAKNLHLYFDATKGNWQTRLSYRDRYDIGSGVGGAQALDPAGRSDDKYFQSDLIYRNSYLNNQWRLTAQLSFTNTKITNFQYAFPPGTQKGTYPEGQINFYGISERRTYFDVSTFYSGFADRIIRLGMGYHYDDVYETINFRNIGYSFDGKPIPPGSPLVEVTDTPYAYLPEKDRSNQYVFIQDEWNLAKNWQLTTGFRYDHYSQSGNALNPRLALVWQWNPQLTLKWLYGQAFRVPHLGELYAQSAVIQQGNPDLEPEEMATHEWMLNYRLNERANLALNLFRYRWDDLIDFYPQINKTVVAGNGGYQKGQGFEIEGRFKLTKKLSLLANYAYQDTENAAGQEAANAPHHKGYVRTDWLIYPNWYLDTQILWIADRPRGFGDSRPQIADYTTLDLSLRHKDIRRKHWDVAFGIRNLLDEDVREPSPGPNAKGEVAIPNDFPLAGRNYFLELRYRF